MYLKRLTLFGFGQFHDRTFELAPGLNVLLGPNEAGKSTITQFITAILFGFPTKKHPELRYEPLDGSRFGGSVELVKDGNTYQVTRVDGARGGKVTLKNLTTDLALPATQLPKLLAPVDAQLFANVYALDERRLGTVFQASKQAVVAHLRHVGAVGSDFWLAQAQQLDKAADERYKPQGRNPLLNQQLRQHRELTDRLEKANAAYQTYWQLLQDQATAHQRQADLQQKLATARRQVDELTQQRQAWPIYQQWVDLGQTVSVPDTGFTEDDVTAFERVTSQVTAAQSALKADQQRLQNLQSHTQLPKLFQEALKVTPQLTPLLEQLPTVTETEQERARLLAQQRDLEQRTTGIERQYATTAGRMPRPFSLATTQQFKQLQDNLTLANQKRRRLQQELNQANEDYRRLQPTRQSRNPLADKQVGWLAAGLVTLIGAMFLPGTVFKLVGAALGIVIGYYGVFIVDSQTPASRQLQELSDDIRDLQAQLREGGQRIDEVTDQIDAIGAAHDLGRLPAEQWLAAQAAIGEWERLTQQLDSVHQRLAATAATQQDFYTAVTRLLPSLAQQELREVLAQLERLQTTQQQLATQDGELAGLTAQLKRDQVTLTTAQAAQRTFLQTRNVSDETEFYQQYQTIREQGNRAAQRQALATQLGAARLTQLQQTDLTTLTQAATTAQTTAADLQHQLDTVTTQLATLAGQLTHLTTSGTQATLRQKLANLETQMQTTAREWLLDRLTSQWIAATLEAASGDRLPQIVAQAGDFYAQLTENRYTKIELTAATLRVQRADGAWRTVGQLSRGTAEQLDLAVKLAFAVVMQPQAAMPIVIDDGLVNFDADRRQAAYQLLAKLGHHLQIILLTADTAAQNVVQGPTNRVLRLTSV
ncbi:AAA family ATPase [Levilactobacillus zymae]|uniref:ATP-binding protein n=1 Tax=Levilactobacillus zymae TaxID=267363 RepID=UPI0028BC0B83|nr:AAA family ATPase [Levilactobacillus zymae]MDT6980318.1 AAA family ATPase [Levilactobacillus zymae]